MHLGDLAPETQLQIMELCSPGDWCSLARANSSLRDAAERTLYNHIYFHASALALMEDQAWAWGLKKDKSVLHTLASNKEKAAMVKVLYIEFERVGDEESDNIYRSVKALQYILAKLSEALRGMPNLIDLRVVYDVMLVEPSHGDFSRAIRNGCFKLHTLFLAYSHDLPRIMVAQPQLQLMGIYFDKMPDARLTKFMSQLFQNMESRCHTMPAVFTIDCSTSWLAVLDIFPSSHRPGQARKICRDIAASISKCPQGYYRRDLCIPIIDLLGITEENIDLFHEAADALEIYMNRSPFLGIAIHSITQKPWKMFPNFLESLTRFKNIQIFSVFIPEMEEDDLNLFLQDLATSLIPKLRRAWPKLTAVMVQDHVLKANVNFDHGTDWQPVKRSVVPEVTPVSDEEDEDEDEGEDEDEDE